MTSKVKRLVDYIGGTKAAYVPSTYKFVDIDVTQLTDDLKLYDSAERTAPSWRGVSAGSDPVEQKIITRVRKYALEAGNDYRAALDLYDSRLRDAAIDDSAFVSIKVEAESGLTNFIGQAVEDRRPITQSEENVQHVCRQFAKFVSCNKLLDTAPIITDKRSAAWTLVSFFLLETMINGVFFSEGSMQGLVGGFVEAFLLSAFNLFAAALIGLVGFRYARHVAVHKKAFGVVTFILAVGFMLILNLLIAHYREAFVNAAGGLVDAGKVFERLIHLPFTLTDSKSWLLGGLGIVICMVEAFSFFHLGDPYPGYERIAKRREKARNMLADKIKHCVETLTEHRDAATQEMMEVIDAASLKKRDFHLAMESRLRLHREYNEYLDRLEMVCAELANIYRMKICEINETPVFWEPLEAGLQRPDDLAEAFGVQVGSLDRAINTMDEYIGRISRAYENAVRELDYIGIRPATGSECASTKG